MVNKNKRKTNQKKNSFEYFIGSCCSSIFRHNISTYLEFMLDLTEFVTRPGSLIYEVIISYF